MGGGHNCAYHLRKQHLCNFVCVCVCASKTEMLNISKLASLFTAGVCGCKEIKPHVQNDAPAALSLSLSKKKRRYLTFLTLTIYIHDTEYIITAQSICVAIWGNLLDVARVKFWKTSRERERERLFSFLTLPWLSAHRRSCCARRQFIFKTDLKPCCLSVRDFRITCQSGPSRPRQG